MPEETGPSGNRIRQESPTPSEAGISVYEIILLLIRRRSVVLAITSGFAAAALLIAFLAPRTYTATTTVLPPTQAGPSSAFLAQLGTINSIIASSSSSSSGGSGGPSDPRDPFIGLLRSESVENAVISRYGLRTEYRADRLSDARRALEDHVVIFGRDKNGQVRLTVQAYSPARAAELANGYVEQYQNFASTLAKSEAAQRRRFLEAQVQEANARLVRSEEDLKQMEQATGMIQLSSQASALIVSSAQIQSQIAAREVEVQSMRAYAGPGDPKLLEAEEELRGLKAQLTKLDTGRNDPNGLVQSAATLTQTGLDYQRKLRELKYDETLQQILSRQYAAARLDETRDATALQIIDIARPTERASSPSRSLLISAGVLLGLLVSVLLLVFREGLRAMEADPDYAPKLRELYGRSRAPLPAGN